jgi:hypothetical protein
MGFTSGLLNRTVLHQVMMKASRMPQATVPKLIALIAGSINAHRSEQKHAQRSTSS